MKTYEYSILIIGTCIEHNTKRNISKKALTTLQKRTSEVSISVIRGFLE